MLMRSIQKGGASQNWVWIGKLLAENGHEVVALNYKVNRDIEVGNNVKWIKRFDLENKGFITKLLAIRKEIKTSEADVCISFLLDANIFNILACLGLRTKSVVCERNDPFKPGYWKLRICKPLFRLANGAVFQLSKVAEYYDNIKGPTAVIPNPVLFPPTIQIKPSSGRENKICVIGRFDIFQKRNDVMVDAFKIFVDSFPNYKLYFFGRGGNEEKVKQQVKMYRLEDKILFPGFTFHPQEEMASAKMFVLTSDFEGIPNTLMDAMALGLPCVSTNCRPGGAALLIEDGVNGFLVEKGNAKAIAEKMIMIASNPILADKIGLEAKKITSQFSTSIIGGKWNAYIKQFEKRK